VPFRKAAARLEIELAIDMMYYLLYWQGALPRGLPTTTASSQTVKAPADIHVCFGQLMRHQKNFATLN
jgi:hypothetical protein